VTVGVPIKCGLAASAAVADVDASIAAVNIANVVVGKFISFRRTKNFIK
jgi:hypothetical protein